MAKENAAAVNADSEVKTTALAGILGISGRRVQQLAQDDILRPVRKGWFALGDSVQRYIAYLEKSRRNGDADLEKERQEAEVKLKKAKSIVAMHEADELDGKMHRAEDVQAMTEQLITAIRNALTALPGRLAADVAACKTPAEASRTIRKEISAVLRELKGFRYDPAKYAELVRGRRNWEAEHHAEEE